MQWASAEDAGYDAQALEAARTQADKVQSAAVMVVADGRVLAAWGDVARKLELHSVRKSIYAAMYGAAAKRNLIDVTDTLAELGVDDLQSVSAAERTARLEDLLYARSGVYHPSAYGSETMDRNLPARGSHPPNTFWYYNNWDFNVAGSLLERAAGKPLGVALDEWIARPVQMEDFQPTDVFPAEEPQTSKWPALTMRMSARDLARFGLLWLQKGQWQGREVIPAAWVEAASTPRSTLPNRGDGYAMMWWTHAAGAMPAERFPTLNRHAMIRASGTGGQSIVIIPDLDLVFVHRADTDHGRVVPNREIFGILETIVAGRRGAPRENAGVVPMQAVALSSQLPAVALPQPVSVDPSALAALVGRYQFSPEFIATVYLHDGRLFATAPGAEAELFAKSPYEFFARIDPTGYLRFEGDTVKVRIKGKEMTGKRVP